MVEIKIPISVGELIDKITILQIKAQHIENQYVIKELKDLKEISKQVDYNKNLEEELYVINTKLWDVENALRLKEKEQDFSSSFIKLARDVYFLNDKRAEIKRKINEDTGSLYKEIKCY